MTCGQNIGTLSAKCQKQYQAMGRCNFSGYEEKDSGRSQGRISEEPLRGRGITTVISTDAFHPRVLPNLGNETCKKVADVLHVVEVTGQ